MRKRRREAELRAELGQGTVVPIPGIVPPRLVVVEGEAVDGVHGRRGRRSREVVAGGGSGGLERLRGIDQGVEVLGSGRGTSRPRTL